MITLRTVDDGGGSKTRFKILKQSFYFRERDRIRQEMINLQDDVKTLHAQQKILEAQEKRQNKHYEASKKFEATHINLLHFYRTIYLGVEEIFLGAKVSDNRIVSWWVIFIENAKYFHSFSETSSEI